MEIFIGNIPYDTTADELEGLLAHHGRVDRVHLPVDAAGRPRGFGFATMPVPAHAAAAIAALDGSRLKGRSLRVNEAPDRNDRRPRDDRRQDTATTSPTGHLRRNPAFLANAPTRDARPTSPGRVSDTKFRRNPPKSPMPLRQTNTARPTGTTVTPVRAHTRRAVLAAAIFAIVLAASVLLDLVSSWILAAYALLSLLTFLVYAFDKDASQRGNRRVAEGNLHLLSLAGGWPGASVARHQLRHKTVKQPFRTVFAITILANCAGFAWLFTADGASAQQQLDSFIAAFASQLD